MTEEIDDEWVEPWEDAAREEEHRLWHPVGRSVDLPRFEGVTLGDDVSWVGSHVMRIVAIQGAGGSGTTAAEQGKHWETWDEAWGLTSS